MGRVSLLAVAACAASLAVAGCGSDDPAGSQPFSLELRVVDPAGQPLAGYEARLHVPIPGTLGFPAKPMTRIRFDVAAPCSARVVAFDLDGAPAVGLLDGSIATGAHEVAFSRLAGDEPLIGTRVYRVELSLYRDGVLDFRDDLLATLYASLDYDQRPVLGVTDGDGRLAFADAREFPFLYGLGPQPLLDEAANTLGEFVIGSDVVVTLTEPGTGLRLDRELTIVPGPNAATLVWDPARAGGASAPRAGSLVQPPVRAADAPFDPPVDRLVACYPNPFN